MLGKLRKLQLLIRHQRSFSKALPSDIGPYHKS